MRLILAANTMENPHFAHFIRDAGDRYEHAAFIVCGDLLNVFPEPGEDLRGSIFYDLYGELLVKEMRQLSRDRFASVEQSGLLAPLKEFFSTTSAAYQRARAIARERYQTMFTAWQEALGAHHLYFIPGNMDYPDLAWELTHALPTIHFLDGDIVTVEDCQFAGLGGIPNTIHPFRYVAAISPYELPETQYSQRLAHLHGAKVLITHLSPQEWQPLQQFIWDSPLQLLICRAPFSLVPTGSVRGPLFHEVSHGKTILRVRPFDYPHNPAYVIALTQDGMQPQQIDVFDWYATTVPTERPAPTSPSYPTYVLSVRPAAENQISAPVH